MLNTLPALPALAAPSAPPAPQANAGAKSENHAFARELARARPALGSAPAAQSAPGKAPARAADSQAEAPPKQDADVEASATDTSDTQDGEPLASENAAPDLSSLLSGLLVPAATADASTRGAMGAAVAAEARTLGARQRASARQANEPALSAAGDGIAAQAGLPAGLRQSMSPLAAADTASPLSSRHAEAAASAPSAAGDATLAAAPALKTDLREVASGNAVEPAQARDAKHAETSLFTAASPAVATTSTPASALARFEAAAAPATPAPYAAQIAAPVGSPEFAPGLSAQLSVMVRDGLQEARLQLNPAEMGPITVQIQLDGPKAQVTLVAEQAPTRQALEQAMPTLAGALREEGLTLTGGGVFEQAPQNAQQQQQQQAQRDAAAALTRRAGRQPSGDDDPLAMPAAAAARAGSRRGVLDVYA
jgi:flagellar hook-length control protein FliK